MERPRKDFFKILGINPSWNGFEPWPPKNNGIKYGGPSYELLDDITKIQGLKEIRLRFSWYQYPRHVCSQYGDSSGEPCSWEEDSEGCPKIYHNTLVDWILTLAYIYLRKMPIITIYGDISDDVRTEWTKIFGEKPENRKENMDEEVAKIKATPQKKL